MEVRWMSVSISFLFQIHISIWVHCAWNAGYLWHFKAFQYVHSSLSFSLYFMQYFTIWLYRYFRLMFHRQIISIQTNRDFSHLKWNKWNTSRFIVCIKVFMILLIFSWWPWTFFAGPRKSFHSKDLILVHVCEIIFI